MNKHAHWKIWGHTAKCSECGFCEVDVNHRYCMNCGAIMDGKKEIGCPNFDEFELPEKVKCRNCGVEILVIKSSKTFNYCPRCGFEARWCYGK